MRSCAAEKHPAGGAEVAAARHLTRRELVMLLREPAKGWLDTRVHDQVLLGAQRIYRAKVVSRRTFSRVFVVQVEIGAERVKLLFFRFGRGLTDLIREGMTIYVEGIAKAGDGGVEMAQPKVMEFEELPKPDFVPVYSSKVDRRELDGLVAGVLDGSLTLPVPEAFIESESLTPFVEVVRKLHRDGFVAPEREWLDHTAAAIEAWLLAESIVKASSIRREPLGATVDMAAAARDAESRLGFRLTGDQRSGLEQIGKMLSGVDYAGAMLIGDVGTGKSLVAAVAARAVLDAGHAVLVMEPNSILARQIADTFRRIGIEPQIVTGSDDGAPAAHCVIGTHALLHRAYGGEREIGLVVVDETQKFGVSQFQSLFRRHERARLLQMTATPLPRSMMRSRLGGMKVLRMRETPRPRTVQTHVVTEPGTLKRIVISAMRREGTKMFIVHPSIGSHVMESVNRTYRNMTLMRDRGLFPATSELVVLHGDMDEQEKERALRRFMEAPGSAALICTSIVEIGVDCEGANVVVVRDASRHGLSQLHQIRGRVGRHGETGHCFLYCAPDAKPEVYERLAFFAATNDGFEIADYDMQLRGYGDLIGLAQKGRIMRLDLTDALHFHLFHAAMAWMEEGGG